VIEEYNHENHRGERVIRRPKFKKEAPKNTQPHRMMAPAPHILEVAKPLFDKIESGNIDQVGMEL
jgi:hypothetical protein